MFLELSVLQFLNAVSYFSQAVNSTVASLQLQIIIFNLILRKSFSKLEGNTVDCVPDSTYLCLLTLFGKKSADGRHHPTLNKLAVLLTVSRSFKYLVSIVHARIQNSVAPVSSVEVCDLRRVTLTLRPPLDSRVSAPPFTASPPGGGAG